MTDCVYCCKPVLDGQELDSHRDYRVCSLEWNKRFDSDICVRCGKENEPDICSNCKINKLDYSGYEGPQ